MPAIAEGPTGTPSPAEGRRGPRFAFVGVQEFDLVVI